MLKSLVRYETTVQNIVRKVEIINDRQSSRVIQMETNKLATVF